MVHPKGEHFPDDSPKRQQPIVHRAPKGAAHVLGWQRRRVKAKASTLAGAPAYVVDTGQPDPTVSGSVAADDWKGSTH